MDTIGRVINLANERSLSLFRLSQICDVPTLKNAEKRGSQLAVSTIEKICDSLGMTMSEFFKDQ